MPRELWEDRIWRLKQMGFNCAQSYVFWNATEPREGQWNLTDNLDLDAWLSTLQKMGMYALVRPGPYACAEWEEGGYPAWLSIKPGMVQREMGPLLPFSDPYMNKMEEIVARHQVNRGGNVFLLQLENEHSRGWGTQSKIRISNTSTIRRGATGSKSPCLTRGLHHSHDPSGETPFPPGASPWYSTEFWTGWIGKYGEMPPGTLAEKTRGSWKAIAFGGAGYNYYMAHGGTNFGYSGRHVRDHLRLLGTHWRSGPAPGILFPGAPRRPIRAELHAAARRAATTTRILRRATFRNYASPRAPIRVAAASCSSITSREKTRRSPRSRPKPERTTRRSPTRTRCWKRTSPSAASRSRTKAR